MKTIFLWVYAIVTVILHVAFLKGGWTSPTAKMSLLLIVVFIALSVCISKEKIDYTKNIKLVHDRYLRYLHYLTLTFISGLLVPYIIIQGNRKIDLLGSKPQDLPDFSSLWIVAIIISFGLFVVFFHIHEKLICLEYHSSKDNI